MKRSVEQRGFVIESSFKNGGTLIATQRAFCTHLQLVRCARVHSQNTILEWVDSKRAIGSTLKKKPPGRPKTDRTPVTVEAVKQVGSPVASSVSESDEQLQKTSQYLYQYPRTTYGGCCIPQVNCINL